MSENTLQCRQRPIQLVFLIMRNEKRSQMMCAKRSVPSLSCTKHAALISDRLREKQNDHSWRQSLQRQRQFDGRHLQD